MKLKLLHLSIALYASTALCGTANAQALVGITQDDKIFTMSNVAAPAVTSTPIAVTGMTAGQTIVGADYRPTTGELYILGYNSTTTDAQLYTLNTLTGVATVVNATPVSLALGTNSAIGFDFNPTVDRIRVVGANKKNYRLNPVTGAIAATDLDLSYAVGDVNAAASATVGAVAYSNSYVGAGLTTLYNYDMALNVITTQIPPNSGTLNTVGSSGIVVNLLTHSIDMDIFMDPISLTNAAYLAANTGASVNDNLYSVNLTTGAVSNVGLIGGGLDVKNIALPINRTQPALTGRLVYGLQSNTNTLLSFDSDNPRLVRSFMPITGVTTGQTIVGLDFRPADGWLYALGYNQTTTEYQLYTINLSTAAATAVNTTPIVLNLGSGTDVAFDFNPVADRIRVISRKTGANVRLNPIDGSVAATDAVVAYAATDVNAGKSPRIGAVAYTNSYAGATVTELFALDDSLGAFLKIANPNSGELTTTSSSVFSVNLADMTSDIDFFYDSVAMTSVGYVSANILGSITDKLYTINTSGAISVVGDIGLGISMSDIAVQPQYKNPTGIAGVTTSRNSFVMYPNPARDEVYISLPANTLQAEVSVRDIAGREVLKATMENNRLSIGGLEQGVYFLTLKADGEIYQTQKLIKQ